MYTTCHLGLCSKWQFTYTDIVDIELSSTCGLVVIHCQPSKGRLQTNVDFHFLLCTEQLYLANRRVIIGRFNTIAVFTKIAETFGMSIGIHRPWLIIHTHCGICGEYIKRDKLFGDRGVGDNMLLTRTDLHQIDTPLSHRRI